MIRVAVLASGTGSNAMKLLHHAKNLTQLCIPLVIVDQKSSLLLETVKNEFPEVSVQLIEVPQHKNSAERKIIHENEMLAILKEYKIDWCFLAGYMRLIGPTILQAFDDGKKHKIVNIHPSLLPKYPGLHAYEQAYESNEKVSGITIHFVDEGLDTGPIIAQETFERGSQDSLEEFILRGKQLEWKLYPNILSQLNDKGDL